MHTLVKVLELCSKFLIDKKNDGIHFSEDNKITL